jgi:hypothetical protein
MDITQIAVLVALTCISIVVFAMLWKACRIVESWVIRPEYNAL